MTIPRLITIQSELPIRLTRFKLNDEKRELFNSGKFARTDYKYLYTLVIDKGKGKTYIQCASPSFKQILYSIKQLWNSYDGKPYDRHEHPVVMQAFDVNQVPVEDLGLKPLDNSKQKRNNEPKRDTAQSSKKRDK